MVACIKGPRADDREAQLSNTAEFSAEGFVGFDPS